MDAPPLGRALSFIADFSRRQAATVLDVPGGFAVLSPAHAASYLHNKLILTAPADADSQAPAGAGSASFADRVVAAADRVLGGAGLAHRLVDALVDVPAQPFLDAGYEHSVNLVMRHGGGEPDRAADPGIRVEAIDLDTMVADGRREWREQYPDMKAAAIEQLASRRASILRGAGEVTFLGVRGARGATNAVVARADLYVDRAGGVAQIESVMTDPAHRGRGLAQALLAEGLRRARAAGCDLIFLVADADDWPRTLYARLGYVPIGSTHEFLRPSPS